MHLAQLNLARLLYAQDDPRVADFMDNLALVNAIAERSPGFMWRCVDSSGNATDTRALDDPSIIVNLSVWESREALEAFVFKTVHAKFYARRGEWFNPAFKPALAMWWVEPGTRPTVTEALARWTKLRDEGPGDDVFGWPGRGA